MLMVKFDQPYLLPYGDVAWEVFDHIRKANPVLVTVEQPRNPEHHRKLWALARAVANFGDHFLDAEDAVDWVKLHIAGMHRRYRLVRGTPVIHTKSINFASMDQLEFNKFYDRALELWGILLKCDPEALLEHAKDGVLEGQDT
jgi:Protein of unknown function (DUF1367)